MWLTLLAVAPAVAILAYYLRAVRSAPEPPLRVALCCVLGGVGFFAASAVEQRLGAVVPRTQPWLWALLAVAPTEEILKVVAVCIAAPPTRFERVSSGLVYGVAAGAAFACVENVAYVSVYGATTGVLRAVTAVPAHALHGAILGLGLGLIHRTEGSGRRVAIAGVALLVAVAMHGVYDGILLDAERLRGLAVVLVAFEALAVRYTFRRVLERDLQRDIDRLAAAPIFEGVPGSSLRILADGATRQRARAGAVVLKQGRSGDSMFQIMRGRVAVFVDGEQVNELEAGAFFGELSLLSGAPRSADVVAAEDTRLLRVPRSTLLRAVRQDETLSAVVIERGRARFPEADLPNAEALAKQAAAPRADGLAGRLAECAIFRDLAVEDHEALAATCITIRRRAGTKLVGAGRAGPGLCLLLSGQAEVELPGRKVWLAEGDEFGEISLLTGWSATATVVGRSALDLAVLRWIDLERVLAQNPALGMKLLSGVASRLARERGAPPVTTFTTAIWRGLAQVGRALSPWDAETEALYQAFPTVRSLPRSTVETLAKIAKRSDAAPSDDGAVWIQAGDGLDGALGRSAAVGDAAQWWRIDSTALTDGIAREPNLVRFFARLLAGGAPKPHRNSDDGSALVR